MKSLRTAWIVAASLAITLISPMAEAENQNTLEVSGTGSTHPQPDAARITLALFNTAESATDALQANTVQLAVLREQLATFDLPQTAIMVSVPRLDGNFNKRGISSYDTITGFTARRTVSVTVTDLAQLAPMLDAIVQSRAAALSDLSYLRLDRAADLKLARERAVAAARLKADTYANAAGVSLGPVLSLTEVASTPTNAGNAGAVSVSATVTLTFAIIP